MQLWYSFLIMYIINKFPSENQCSSYDVLIFSYKKLILMNKYKERTEYEYIASLILKLQRKCLSSKSTSHTFYYLYVISIWLEK